MVTKESIQRKYKPLRKIMDEKMRRLWAAGEAEAIGWGGVSLVAEATGHSRTTITAAIKELSKLRRERKPQKTRVRQPGSGRKRLTYKDPKVIEDLQKLVEPFTRGDPQSPLRWTCKSTRKLSQELKKKGHNIGWVKVVELLHELNYSLQSNRKANEGSSHPDRNAQFEYINKQTKKFQIKGTPIISVDAKKKERIGDFKNEGKEWRPKGQPEKVRIYDFEDKELGKGLPYGVYDITANKGWVSVGIDHDTAEFAGETIKRWWRKMGSLEYPNANELLIIADGGGSNGSRSRLWKVVLQKLANETGLNISICHFPPGTSKWNKIEHRMFSSITQNWRGKPLVSREVLVNLIGNTTTINGLKIKAQLDKKKYNTGIKISDKELDNLNIEMDSFHGEWNYKIIPKQI